MSKFQNIFDTHSHYDDEQFDSDRNDILLSLQKGGVDTVISCGYDLKSTKLNRDLANKYDFLYFAAGLHPENLSNVTENHLDEIKQYAADKKCVAIGEIGLDYHWMESSKETQKFYFEKQIELASQLNMPIIVHDREAHSDTMEILKKHRPKGVVHCFSGSKESALELIKMGIYIGVNGVATFKNARKSLEVAAAIPLEYLLLETDCPYLAPEPFRGKRNDSTLIPYVAQKIAEIRGISTQQIIDITNQNAKRLFHI